MSLCARLLILLLPALLAAEAVAVRVDAVGDPDPTSQVWSAVQPSAVTMLPQSITFPGILQATIPQLQLQIVQDGTDIAFRVAWADQQPDATVDSGRFGDAVAIQFPLTEHANPMMGVGGKVQILHWKAVWQKDINEGFQDVHVLYPNAWTDLYWFATGEHPFPITTAFEDPRAQQWLIAYSAGNPMSDFKRSEPCEEAVAAGFGTLTTQEAMATVAKGVWASDTWAVVFKRPMRTGDPDDAQFSSGPQQIACAVWQGSEGQVGGRKQWSVWVPFTIP